MIDGKPALHVTGDWEVTLVALGDIHPSPWNPRTITQEDFEALCRSLEEWPQFLLERPAIVQASTGDITGGNMRYRGLLRLASSGARYPTMYRLPDGRPGMPARIRDMDDRTAKAFALIDNNVLGDYQPEETGALLQGLKDVGIDPETLAFRAVDLEEFLESSGSGSGREHVEFDADADALPEGDLAAVARPGDLWLLGDHRVACGDSTDPRVVDLVLGQASPRLMVTDPPYGVDYDPHWRDDVDGTFGSHGEHPAAAGEMQGDSQIDWRQAWALSPAPVAYVWHAAAYSAQSHASLSESGYLIRNQIVWVKQHFSLSRGHYHWQHEPCWYAVRPGATADWIGPRNESTTWQINSLNPAGRQEERVAHASQKPIECMGRPLRNHRGDVYDPFLGSGTTLVAAETLGRVCYGIDIEPACVDLAVARWERMTGRKAEVRRGG